MLNPFEPARPWTAEKHRQWADDRTRGKATYYRAAIGVWLRSRGALIWTCVVFSYYLLLVWLIVGNELQFERLLQSPAATQPMLIGLVLFACMMVLHPIGKASERWKEHEQLYQSHEAPYTRPVTVVGHSPERLFALTNTPDFADTVTCQLLGFADGAWTPLHTSRRGPAGLDLALLPGGGLAITYDDQSVTIISPAGVSRVATPRAAGFVVPLAGDQLLVVGDKQRGKSSARVTPGSGAVEELDLLTSIAPSAHNGKAYLFDHGRYQLAVLGGLTAELIAHRQTWNPLALTVSPDGRVYAAVYPRSGGDIALWVYDGAWSEVASLPFMGIWGLTHDGAELLALTELGIVRLNADGSAWAVELSAEEPPFNEDLHHILYWQLRALRQGVVAMEMISGDLLVRRDGVWEPLPPVPALVQEGAAPDLWSWLGDRAPA